MPEGHNEHDRQPREVHASLYDVLFWGALAGTAVWLMFLVLMLK